MDLRAKQKWLLPLAAVVAAILGYGVSYWLHAPTAITATTPVAAFNLRDLTGKPHTLADWRGKIVVLNFWATWCPPCRAEIPLLMRAQQRYGDKGVQIVGIAVDNADAVARFSAQVGINYPLLTAEEDGVGLMEKLGDRSGSLPYSVIIAPDGHQLARKLGAYSERELTAVLNRSVNAAPSPP